MKREMRIQIYRMLGILGFLIIMTIWQFDFVVTAVASNVFLNMSIIGFFVFGCALVYKNLRKMPNEIIAFESLKEFHSDVLTVQSGLKLDPYWKYHRCEKMPILFKKPEVLGQAYHLIYEHMARTNRLKISATTMQTLVDGLDARLFDHKSLMQYITGLLVFMGLIGTFIGLMSTLASVGEIIGGLDLSSGAGIAVIQTLMTNLQKPLVGMATGFSSSLFGLITSLALGLMSRFAAKHNDILKTTFEDWLASAAQLDEDDDTKATDVSGSKDDENHNASELSENSLDHRDLRLLYRVAKHSVKSNQKVNDQLEKLTNSVQNIVEQRHKDQQELSNFAMHVANISTQQKEFGYMIDKTADAIAAQQTTADNIQNMDTRLEQRFEEFAFKTESIKITIADELSKVDYKIDNNLTAMNNNIGRLERNQNDQIEQLKQLLVDEAGVNKSPKDDIFDEFDVEKNELTQMINQLDNLIKVNQLSNDDIAQLKTMSRLFDQAEPNVESPHSIKDLFDRIIENYGEMQEPMVETQIEEFKAAVGDYPDVAHTTQRFQNYNEDNNNDQHSINDMFTSEEDK